MDKKQADDIVIILNAILKEEYIAQRIWFSIGEADNTYEAYNVQIAKVDVCEEHVVLVIESVE